MIVTFGRTRHIIEFDTRENLKTIILEFVQPNVVTALHCTPEDLYDFREIVKGVFTNKFVYTRIFPLDIVQQTHCRAHRNSKENHKQIYKQYYWPKMLNYFKEYIKQCDICNKNKYNRHPQRVPIGEAPIRKEGEHLNIDIFFAENLKFITCIDSYSKFMVIKNIEGKTNLEEKVLDALQSFPNAKKVTLGNEPGFLSAQFKSLMQRLRIKLYCCTPRHSNTNGQIERPHSTLAEIARCLKEEVHLVDNVETFYRAVTLYNHTIHSVTQNKPVDIFFNKAPPNLVEILKKAQDKMILKNNRSNIKSYQPGDVIYEKIIGQRNKLLPRYRKQKVKADLCNKVKIQFRDRIEIGLPFLPLQEMTNVFVILLAILNICNSEVQILDYSHSQLISIHLEKTRLQNGNFKLIHVLELTEYKRTIDDIELEIQEKVLGNSTVLPFLLYDIKQLRDALKRITPRKKR